MESLQLYLLRYSEPLHPLPITLVSRERVKELRLSLAEEKSRIVANHFIGYVCTFFEWCRKGELITKNPAEFIEKFPTQDRERFLSADEIRYLWLATEDYGVKGDIFRLLVLTGCRSSEIADLRWTEVHDDALEILTSRMKTKRTLCVPLTPQMNAILAGYSKDDGACVFREDDGGRRPFRIDKKSYLLNDRLREAGDPNERTWTPHDLRRTVKTGMCALGILPVHADMVQGHATQSKVHYIYNKYDHWRDKLHALTIWNDHVDRIISGEITSSTVIVPAAERGAQVIPLPYVARA
jgi:integrase